MPKHVRDNSGEGGSRKSVARDMLLRFEKIRKQRLVGDVKYWRELAEEKRTEAEFTTQPIRRATLKARRSLPRPRGDDIHERSSSMNRKR